MQNEDITHKWKKILLPKTARGSFKIPTLKKPLLVHYQNILKGKVCLEIGSANNFFAFTWGRWWE